MKELCSQISLTQIPVIVSDAYGPKYGQRLTNFTGAVSVSRLLSLSHYMPPTIQLCLHSGMVLLLPLLFAAKVSYHLSLLCPCRWYVLQGCMESL